MQGLDAIQSMIIAILDENGESDSVSAHEHFTCGSCAELAEAVSALLPKSRIVEIRVHIGPVVSQLVHAGVEFEGMVVDIDGVTDIGDWLRRWAGRWHEPMLSYRRRTPDRLAFWSETNAMAAKEVAALLVDACSLRLAA